MRLGRRLSSGTAEDPPAERGPAPAEETPTATPHATTGPSHVEVVGDRERTSARR